jgi:hypothetical protein
MSSHGEKERGAERPSSISVLLATSEVITRVLTGTSVGAPVLQECLYYAAEDDLLRLMRLAAALDPQRRLQAEEQLQTLLLGQAVP